MRGKRTQEETLRILLEHLQRGESEKDAAREIGLARTTAQTYAAAFRAMGALEATAPEKVSRKTCPHCGASADADARFCPQCGERFLTEEEALAERIKKLSGPFGFLPESRRDEFIHTINDVEHYLLSPERKPSCPA